jgi:hypothetical protein
MRILIIIDLENKWSTLGRIKSGSDDERFQVGISHGITYVLIDDHQVNLIVLRGRLLNFQQIQLLFQPQHVHNGCILTSDA